MCKNKLFSHLELYNFFFAEILIMFSTICIKNVRQKGDNTFHKQQQHHWAYTSFISHFPLD